MTGENIFVVTILLYFYVKTATPLKKVISSFPATPLWKLRPSQALPTSPPLPRERERERERELLFFSIFQNFLALQTRLLKGNFLHGPLFLSLLWWKSIDNPSVLFNLLTLNVPCISEKCVGIKIKLNFYFHTSVVPQKVLWRP